MLKQQQHFQSTVLEELEKYFVDKAQAKKIGHIVLSSFIIENRVRHKELTDVLKVDVKDMINELNDLNVDLNDAYEFRNKSMAIYKKIIADENKEAKMVAARLKSEKQKDSSDSVAKKDENSNDIVQAKTYKESIEDKIKDLKKWYSEYTRITDAEIDELEKLIIRSKHVLARVEERRFLDLRPKHLIVAIGLTFIFALITGLLINYIYLIPLKGIRPNVFSIVVMCLFGIISFLFWLQLILRHSFGRLYLNDDKEMWRGGLAGFISAFTDTLGIGSFAMATATFKITKAIRPHEFKKLPGTLNVGLAVPQMFAGILFLGAIEVDILTLSLFCVATVIGTLGGSFIVEKVHRTVIAFVMGISLLVTATLMILVLTNVLTHDVKTGLSSKEDIPELILGMFMFVVIGVLMSFGVGLYAPSMVAISVLGLNPLTSIPIMTCAAAVAQQTAAWRYSATNNFLPKISLNMIAPGIISVLIAFIVVFVVIIGNDPDAEALMIKIMRSTSVVVILATSASLLRNVYMMKSDAKIAKVNEAVTVANTSVSEKYTSYLLSIKDSM
ncbi:hypothetical protein [Spiroplasma endosymbiont of Othius punctulatus]|uniref:hypothetical protein n=1 Tax=Spiroplasma endosymbiont of Othius punctulatus TaxID=3066289 RepID=UPI0030D2180E